MSGRRSKNKGSTYERSIAGSLSSAFSPLHFKRVPLSGGWDKSKIIGDLVPWVGEQIAFFAFGIECKNHASLDLKAWLRQATDDTKDKIQEPVVIFHINRRKGFSNGEDFVAIEKRVLSDFLSSSYTTGGRRVHYMDFSDSSRWKLNEWLQDTFAHQSDKKVRAMFLSYEDKTIVVLRLRDFLAIINKRRAVRKPWCSLRRHLPVSLFTP